MEHAAKGAAALSVSDELAAIAAYTKALIERPTAPDYWTQRSIAFTRLKAPFGPRNDLALKDAEYGVLCGQKRAKRDKIQAAQQRRVVALFGLGRYSDSAFVLQKMVRWRTSEKKDKMEGDIWKAKIEQKLKLGTGKQATDVTAKEYPDFELPDEKELKKELASQFKADGTFRFEDIKDGSGDTPMVGNTSISSNDCFRESASRTDHGQLPVTGKLINGKLDVSQTGPAAAANSTTMKPLSKVRHEWYQNAQSVTVTIYAKGVKKAEADIDIQDDSVSISFPHPSDPTSSFSFALDPLFALIDPANSKCSVMSTKVECILRKQVLGQKWPALEGDAPLKRLKANTEDSGIKDIVMQALAVKSAPSKADSAPSYPTSSKSGPKNWDKLATDLTAKKPKKKAKKGKEKATAGNDDVEMSEEDGEIDSDFDTGDPVDGFFKKLYAGADDDTRRAMMKSFQESNGTALSTNWGEVGKGTVEPVTRKEDA